VAVYKCRDL